MAIKVIFIVFVMGALAGCSMTPEEIKREMDRCKDNGLKPALVRNLWSYEVTKVVCFD